MVAYETIAMAEGTKNAVPTELVGPGLLTLSETARALAVSQRTARRYIADGHLDAVRLGSKTIRVTSDSVNRFANASPIGNRVRH